MEEAALREVELVEEAVWRGVAWRDEEEEEEEEC